MISAQRLTEQLATLSNISAPGEGINRLAFTDSDWQGRSYLMKLMKDAGLTLRVDAFGNVIGHYAGRNDSLPAIMFGSHGDSVPEGGNYDGIVGILSAIETVRSMQEDGYQPEQPLEVVLFMCEESSRFGAATLGSRAMRGELSSEDLHRLKDREGHTLWQVLESRDLHPESIASAQYTKPLKAFMEVHIEQGRVLESAQKQVGIVTGIAAPTRLLCHLHGRADHSGATPMNLRQDGLCAGAEIILAVEQAAKNYTAAPVVGTVGIARVSPGVMNVIPGEVTLGIDIRSISATAKADVVGQIKVQIQAITNRRGIPYDIEPISDERPATMHPCMVKLLADTAGELGLNYLEMPSGAGHDSMHWASYAPTGMLFIPCRAGISHNPAEHAELTDIVHAAQILSTAVRRLAKRSTTF